MHCFSISRRALLGLLACLLLGPSGAQAAPRTGFVEGYITAVRVAPGGRYVTIEEGGVPFTLTVTGRTSVGTIGPPPVPGESRPPGSLTVGHLAQAQYARATRVARSIAASSEPVVRPVRGTLLSADPLALDEDGDGQADFFLSDVRVNGPVLLGSMAIDHSLLPLLEGLTADVLIGIHMASIERVRVELPETRESLAEILEVDAATRTVTLRQGLQGTPVIVAAGAEITARGRSIPLEALRSGDIAQIVTARTPSGHSIALRMRLSRLSVKTASGRLTAIELPARTLTVATRKGSMTFQVPTDGVVMIQVGHDDVVPGTLSELAGRLSSRAILRAKLEYLQ